MLKLLLDAAAGGTGTETPQDSWLSYVMIGVFVVLIVAWFIWSSRSNKKKQKESQDLINAVKPGNKVKTIGGICGIVVEVDDEENTFVLETGSETSGKCYMKFDKQAIYQTDAVVEKADTAAQIETEENLEKAKEAPAGEAPAEEAPEEENKSEE